MLRRLPLRFAAVALVALLGAAGCADDVSPAARIGDDTITHDDLIDEVDAWASSPTLIQTLQIPFLPGSEDTGYSTEFVNVVLSNRISFELHNEEFEASGLDLSDADRDAARGVLAPAMLDELGDDYSGQLVDDIARQFKVQEALGDGYNAWAQRAFTRDDIEVSSRYGGWDRATGTVLAPEPPQGPGGTPVEP